MDLLKSVDGFGCKDTSFALLFVYFWLRDADNSLQWNGAILSDFSGCCACVSFLFQMRAKTTVAVSSSFKMDQMWLNGM